MMMRAGRRGKRGTSLLEVVIAFMVLALAIMGTMSLMLVLETHNASRTDANYAYKACQDTMEQLMAMDWVTMNGQNNVKFAVPAILDNKNNPADPRILIGTVTVTNINPNNLTDATATNDTTGAGAGTMVRVTVTVQTNITRRPINVSVTSWRAN